MRTCRLEHSVGSNTLHLHAPKHTLIVKGVAAPSRDLRPRGSRARQRPGYLAVSTPTGQSSCVPPTTGRPTSASAPTKTAYPLLPDSDATGALTTFTVDFSDESPRTSVLQPAPPGGQDAIFRSQPAAGPPHD